MTKQFEREEDILEMSPKERAEKSEKILIIPTLHLLSMEIIKN
ncbi:MAG TPA: hypothetical protein VE445_01960 [Nitrososphaeraceae archaeon]|jgi:hypothetical protein|nr:hypothetical protein [Nitrososphaeraceae archaeon]